MSINTLNNGESRSAAELTAALKVAEEDLKKAQSDAFLMQKSVNSVAGLYKNALSVKNQMLVEVSYSGEDLAKAKSRVDLLKRVLDGAEAKNQAKISTLEEKKQKLQQLQDASGNVQPEKVANNVLPQPEQQQPDKQNVESAPQVVDLEENALLDKIEGLQQRLAAARTIVDTTNKRIPEIDLKIKEAEAELKKFEADYVRQGRELSARHQATDDEVEKAKLQQQYDELTTQRTEYQQQVVSTQQDFDAALNLRFDTNQAIPFIEFQLAAAQENLDAYREINNLPDDSAELRSLVLKIQEDVVDLEKNIKVLNGSIDKATLVPANPLYSGSDSQMRRGPENDRSRGLRKSRETLQKKFGVLEQKLEAANKKLTTLEQQQPAKTVSEQPVAPPEKPPELPPVPQPVEQPPEPPKPPVRAPLPQQNLQQPQRSEQVRAPKKFKVATIDNPSMNMEQRGEAQQLAQDILAKAPSLDKLRVLLQTYSQDQSKRILFLPKEILQPKQTEQGGLLSKLFGKKEKPIAANPEVGHIAISLVDLRRVVSNKEENPASVDMSNLPAWLQNIMNKR